MDREIYLKMGRPNPVCVLCETPLAEAGKHPSVLLPPEPGAAPGDDIPRRQDYCQQCWEQRQARDYLGFWVTRREPPKPRKVQNRRERNARLAAYFDYFYNEDRAAHAARLFFLAHLLMRYGVLRWVRTEHDPASGREQIIYRHAIADEEVTIESVDVTDEELVQFKREVDELLAGTLRLSDEGEAAGAPPGNAAADGEGDAAP